MRIRWKLLLLLLTLSLGPIFLMRFVGVSAMRDISKELNEHTRMTLTQLAVGELGRLVEDHADIFRRDQIILESLLDQQTEEIQHLLETDVYDAAPYNQIQRGRMRMAPQSARQTTTPPRGMGFFLPKNADAPPVFSEIMDRLSTLPSALSKERSRLPEFNIRHFIVLENGLYAAYPSMERLPGMWDPRAAPWYKKTIAQARATWSTPRTEPVTGRTVMYLAEPIHGAYNAPVGVSGVAVPVEVLFQRNAKHHRGFNVQSFLVQAPQGGAEQAYARVLAQDKKTEHNTSARRRMWTVPQKEQRLQSSDTEQFKEFLADLRNGRSNVLTMPYQDKMSFWSYCPVQSESTILLFIVPDGDITNSAAAAGRYVQDRIDEQLSVTRLILGTALMAITLVALLISRRVSGRIEAVRNGITRVAEGDFTARAPVMSRDEFGQLAATFNNLVPALEDQVRLRDSINLAEEVQHSLLPQHPPVIPGLDIAGASLYCDETGGDLYDYLRFHDSPKALGLAVGDVSGHGVPSALLMTTIRALIRCRAEHPGDLADIAKDVNRLITADTFGSGRFMTLFLLSVCPKSQTLRWTRAGHDPALLYLPQENAFTELSGDSGVPLGVIDDFTYTQNKSTGFPPGAVLVIGTDGIWETTPPDSQEMFGKERLKNLIKEHAHQPAQTIKQTIISAVETYRGPSCLDDDVTLVVVKAV